MSKPSHDTSKEIQSKQELIDWFCKACKPADQQLVGIEHEKPPFYLDDYAPVPYGTNGSKPGIRDFLRALVKEGGWKPVYENGHLIELEKGQLTWSLEPGGQMESGGAPLKSLHDVAEETDSIIDEAVRVGKKLGIGLLALGYHPTRSGNQMPFMPKSRYRAFRDYIKRHDIPHGMDDLSCTSTVQVNLGYESEEDMIKKLRVALSLQPIVASLFANSPFSEGGDTGFQSYRSQLIHNAIGGRYGFMLPVAFEKDFGFERFVDYAMSEIPMMGVYIDGIFIDAKGGKFSDFMQGKLEVCPGRKATMADWENHLNTIWPEVRLRRLLEMRGADVGSQEMIKALPAFWVGLLYDKQALEAVHEMVSNWTNEDREYLRTQTPLTGLQTPFMNGTTTVQEIAKNCLALSEVGLKRRSIYNEKGQDESVYLEPLHEIANSGMNWAQRLSEKLYTSWNGDINKVFQEQSYDKKPSLLRRGVNTVMKYVPKAGQPPKNN